jgi:dTDP-4-dehydrorhamnose 3,5-epimerase
MDRKNRIEKNIDGLLLNSLQNIEVDKGNVLHALKATSEGYFGFGEAYFSIIEYGAIKAWKRHQKMTLNLIVPVGGIKFVVYDDRMDSPTYNHFQEVLLSREGNYNRLTVPPLVWMGFQGLNKGENILLNVADIAHSQNEVEKKSLEELDYDWSAKI